MVDSCAAAKKLRLKQSLVQICISDEAEGEEFWRSCAPVWKKHQQTPVGARGSENVLPPLRCYSKIRGCTRIHLLWADERSAGTHKNKPKAFLPMCMWQDNSCADVKLSRMETQDGHLHSFAFCLWLVETVLKALISRGTTVPVGGPENRLSYRQKEEDVSCQVHVSD